MAHEFLTLADLVKVNDRNLADRDITDLLQDAPLMRALAADVASNGTTHKYLKETGAPVVGFRSPNTGRDNSKSADTEVSIDLKILDGSFAVDKALADAYHMGPEAYVAREAVRSLRACFFAAERQFVNGTGAAADGFVGLADALDADHEMVVDAEGDSEGTASSVYLIRTHADLNDAVAITGRDGQLDIGETVTQRLADGDGKTYSGYYTPIEGWLGLQIGGLRSVGRIINLTAQSGKTLTDALIYQAFSRFPASRMPNLIVMNRRSREQLRASRTATNVTGAPAPIPTDVDGVEILTTDAIGSDESILSGS